MFALLVPHLTKSELKENTFQSKNVELNEKSTMQTKYEEIIDEEDEEFDSNLPYAYVTLCSTDRILNLTLVWAYTLMKTSTPYPVIALVTKEMSQEGMTKLEDIGVDVRIIDNIPQPKQPLGRGARTPRDRSKVFSKLWAWTLKEYSKVVFMDSDILVLKNIDDIFDIPINTGDIASAFYCGFSCDCNTTWNAGVMMIRPNADSFHSLLDGFETVKWGGQGDQGYLNAYYKKYGGHRNITQFYNIGKNVPRCAFDDWFYPDKFRVFHFAGNDHMTHPNAVDPKTLQDVNESVLDREYMRKLEPKKREKDLLKYYQKKWWEQFEIIQEAFGGKKYGYY